MRKSGYVATNRGPYKWSKKGKKLKKVKAKKKRNPIPTTWITAKIRRVGNTVQALIPQKGR